MNNQTLSKIWILIFLIILISGGILVYQYWWKATPEMVNKEKEIVKNAINEFMNTRILQGNERFEILDIERQGPTLKFKASVRTYEEFEEKEIGYFDEDLYLDKINGKYLVSEVKPHKYVSLVEINDWEIYQNKDFGFEFRYPKYWTIFPYEGEIHFCSGHEEGLEMRGPVPRCAIKMSPNNLTFQERANRMKQYHLERNELLKEERKKADVNGDGQIDVLDISLIKSYIEGEIDTFPICRKREIPPTDRGGRDVPCIYYYREGQYPNYSYGIGDPYGGVANKISKEDIRLIENYITTGDMSNYYSPESKEEWIKIFKLQADVNDDGIIDKLDVSLLKEYLEGSIDDFPICKKMKVRIAPCGNKGDFFEGGYISDRDILHLLLEKETKVVDSSIQLGEKEGKLITIEGEYLEISKYAYFESNECFPKAKCSSWQIDTFYKYEGIFDKMLSTFRFFKPPLPKIISVSPKENEINVDPHTSIQIKFNKAINPMTVNKSTIKIIDKTLNKDITELFEFDAGYFPYIHRTGGKETTVILTPSGGNLGAGKQIIVKVSSGVQDIMGNHIQPKEWEFTTSPL